MKVERYGSREQWLKAKPTYVGASDTPALFNCSYRDHTVSRIYADKLCPMEIAPSDPMLLGIHCEAGIINAANEKWGFGIEHSQYTVCRSSERPHIGFTPDGLVEGTHAEIKKLGAWTARKVTEGKGRLPLIFMLQMQHQLYVSGKDRALFVADLANAELFHDWVERDDRMIRMIVRQCDVFWKYVQAQIVPPDNDSQALQEALDQLFPDEQMECLTLDGIAQQLADEYDIANARLAEYEEQRETAKANLKKQLGNAAFGQLPDGRFVSWRHYTNQFNRSFRIIKRIPKGIKLKETQPDVD